MSEPIKFSLQEPIKHGEKEITELMIRCPTTAEIRMVGGFPYKVDFTHEGEPDLDTDRAAKYLSICANIPPSVVNKMDIGDFQAAVLIIYGFFVGSLTKHYSKSAST